MLRRVLNETTGYEAGSVVAAILASGGYTIPEQIAALDVAAKGVKEEIDQEEQAAASAGDANIPLPNYANSAVNTRRFLCRAFHQGSGK